MKSHFVELSLSFFFLFFFFFFFFLFLSAIDNECSCRLVVHGVPTLEKGHQLGVCRLVL